MGTKRQREKEKFFGLIKKSVQLKIIIIKRYTLFKFEHCEMRIKTHEINSNTKILLVSFRFIIGKLKKNFQPQYFVFIFLFFEFSFHSSFGIGINN